MHSSEFMEKWVEYKGGETQMRKLLEECGELITAITQFQQGRAPLEAVLFEGCDVLFLVRQLPFILASLCGETEEEKKNMIWQFRSKMMQKTQRIQDRLEAELS